MNLHLIKFREFADFHALEDSYIQMLILIKFPLNLQVPDMLMIFHLWLILAIIKGPILASLTLLALTLLISFSYTCIILTLLNLSLLKAMLTSRSSYLSFSNE